MKNIIILIIGIICFYNINCGFSKSLVSGIDELKFADDISKNKESNTNIDVVKDKKETNIKTDKSEIINNENKTDNSRNGAIVADIPVSLENKIYTPITTEVKADAKIENKANINTNAKSYAYGKAQINSIFKTVANGIKADSLQSEITGLKSNIEKLSNSLATINETRNNNQNAKTIINKEGIDIKDLAIFLLIVIGGILIIYAKYFMKSYREKKLETAHEELFEKVKIVSNKRNLLKSVAIQMKTESDINRHVLQELFERYESKKFELGIEE